MQPGEIRRFERPERKGAAPPERPLTLPEEGEAVVLDRRFPCPCDRCTVCGGHVDLTLILWVDNWPVRAPEGDEVGIQEAAVRARTLHLSLAPRGLDRQTECSEGCEIAPEEWDAIEAAAFLSMCRAYTGAVDALRAAGAAASEDGA